MSAARARQGRQS